MPNINDILSSPVFENLETERKEFLSSVMSKLEGKNMMEAISILMEARQSMPKGKELSKQEQAFMIKAMLDGMSDQERSKYEKLLKMMGM